VNDDLEIHNFDSKREFYKEFPSRFYICSNCGYMNNSKIFCQKCGWRADGLLKTWGKGYKYEITGEKVQEIFKPIELEKGEIECLNKN